MKVKTSVTLSDDLLRAVDELARLSSRSDVIERALREFFAARARAERDARDLELMNAHADAYNTETADLMTYQTWIDLAE